MRDARAARASTRARRHARPQASRCPPPTAAGPSPKYAQFPAWDPARRVPGPARVPFATSPAPRTARSPTPTHARRDPERTALHRIVREHLATFLDRARDGPDARELPSFVRAFDELADQAPLLAHSYATSIAGQSALARPFSPIRRLGRAELRSRAPRTDLVVMHHPLFAVTDEGTLHVQGRGRAREGDGMTRGGSAWKPPPRESRALEASRQLNRGSSISCSSDRMVKA